MRPVLSNVPWWTQSTCNNWFHWGAFQQSAAILRPLLSAGRQIARGTGGIKCWQNMKDLAAFVRSAELDFVCVNKPGYWLPASQPANRICGEIIGGYASRKIIFAFARVWICLQEVKGCVKYTFGRPAAPSGSELLTSGILAQVV